MNPYGDGFNEEQKKITTLTPFLEFDTWTPLMACLLVNGVIPPQGCTEIPKWAFGLDGCFITEKEDAFPVARWTLELWNSQENAPAKVRPADFVAWCKSKKIDTCWLSEIEDWAPPEPKLQPISAETTPLPVFKLTARPLCVPLELLTLASTTEIRVIYYDGHGNSKASDYIEQLQGIIDRQAKGYFTIHEAAQILAEAVPGVKVKEIIEKMLNAFKNKEFRIRNPDSKISLDKGNFNEIREYRELVKSSDIDTLLSEEGVDYRFPDATPASQATPVVAIVASRGVNWPLVKPQRFPGYRKPLYDLLKAAQIDGKPCPTARNVLDTWRDKMPPEVMEVMTDGLKYYDAKGDAKPADLNAIRKAIGRMNR